MIEPSSRYFALRELTYEAPDGRQIVYKELRVVPRTPAAQAVSLAQSERLDILADRHLGDAKLFWRICDANEELNPFELQAVSGQRLGIPEP